jgi:hypothetical protein
VLAGHPAAGALSAKADPAIVVPSNSAASVIFPMNVMVILQRVFPPRQKIQLPERSAARLVEPSGSNTRVAGRGLRLPAPGWIEGFWQKGAIWPRTERL